MSVCRIVKLSENSALRALAKIWDKNLDWCVQKWNDKLMIWESWKGFSTREEAEQELLKESIKQ